MEENENEIKNDVTIPEIMQINSDLADKTYIDTEGVLSDVQAISDIVQAITEEFENAVTQMNNLDYIWEGQAAWNAVTAFNVIKEDHNAKITQINNYINYIKQVVAGGYTEVETTNKSLADAFK